MQRFNALRQDVDQLWSRLTELDLERQEHTLVLQTLAPLAPERRCFRLIGGVLVERTVGDVAPALSRTKEQLDEASACLLSVIERASHRTSHAGHSQIRATAGGEKDGASRVAGAL